MQLSAPFKISPRLLPGLLIDDAWISIEYAGFNDECRTIYRYYLDLPTVPEGHVGTDLKSGCGGGNLQEGMASLLSFLGAAAESYPDGENADLFPEAVCAWAYTYSDVISMLQTEIKETKGLINE